MNERGMTIVEVLVTMATVAILTGLSFTSFDVYKESARSAISDQQRRNVLTAIEGGQVDASALGTSDFFWAWTLEDGSFIGHRVNEFIPGLVVTENTRVWVEYDSFCDHAIWASVCAGAPCCLRNYSETWHCDGDTVKAWAAWNDGTNLLFEFQNNFGC